MGGGGVREGVPLGQDLGATQTTVDSVNKLLSWATTERCNHGRNGKTSLMHASVTDA